VFALCARACVLSVDYFVNMADTGAPVPQDGVCDGSRWGGPTNWCLEYNRGCTKSDCELELSSLWTWTDGVAPAWPAYAIGALENRYTMIFGDTVCVRLGVSQLPTATCTYICCMSAGHCLLRLRGTCATPSATSGTNNTSSLPSPVLIYATYRTPVSGSVTSL
jgi:hypothetical protein